MTACLDYITRKLQRGWGTAMIHQLGAPSAGPTVWTMCAVLVCVRHRWKKIGEKKIILEVAQHDNKPFVYHRISSWFWMWHIPPAFCQPDEMIRNGGRKDRGRGEVEQTYCSQRKKKCSKDQVQTCMCKWSTVKKRGLGSSSHLRIQHPELIYFFKKITNI